MIWNRSARAGPTGGECFGLPPFIALPNASIYVGTAGVRFPPISQSYD
jgi:hypothetical protein